MLTATARSLAAWTTSRDHPGCVLLPVNRAATLPAGPAHSGSIALWLFAAAEGAITRGGTRPPA